MTVINSPNELVQVISSQDELVQVISWRHQVVQVMSPPGQTKSIRQTHPPKSGLRDKPAWAPRRERKDAARVGATYGHPPHILSCYAQAVAPISQDKIRTKAQPIVRNRNVVGSGSTELLSAGTTAHGEAAATYIRSKCKFHG